MSLRRATAQAASMPAARPPVPHPGAARSLAVRAAIAAIAAIVMLTGATDAARAESIVAFYSAYWSGLPVGQIRLSFAATPTSYRNAIEIRTEGLSRLLSRFQANAEATGRLAPGGAAVPQRYAALYDMKKRRNNRIEMNFVARDGAVIAERGAEDTNRKPSLPEQYRRGIVDPLSAFERVRTAIMQNRTAPDTSFTVPVYDDTRRFDVVGRVLPRERWASGTLRVALLLKPIAGFKGESSEDGDPENAPRPVMLTLTDDQRLLPVSMTVRIFYLPLVVRLDRVCAGDSACPE